MWARMTGMSLKKRGMHFILVNIDFCQKLIKCSIAHITNASIIGISETELDETILSSEFNVNGYDLVRLNHSRKGGGVACYIKSLIAYSYKENFCSNIESTFVDIYLLKSKPILLGILYRPPNKSDFIKQINVFTETGVLNKQESYILGHLNINLLLDVK